MFDGYDRVYLDHLANANPSKRGIMMDPKTMSTIIRKMLFMPMFRNVVTCFFMSLESFPPNGGLGLAVTSTVGLPRVYRLGLW